MTKQPGSPLSGHWRRASERSPEGIGSLEVSRVAFRGTSREPLLDEVAVEEPLEIRIHGVSIAVVMRTPGHDFELARGFAITERIVHHPSQILSIRHCDRVEAPEAEDNVVQIYLRDQAHIDLARLRRRTFVSSSCGVCGKASLAEAMGHADPLVSDWPISISTVLKLPTELGRHQTIFSRTGGLHAAGLFTQDGDSVVVREDVGRHNAVDKVVGWSSSTSNPEPSNLVLAVSGRVSFEVVQKALAARIPVIVAVSAPTSLAIGLADEANITLIGFVREGRASVYSAPQRVIPE